MGLHQCEEKRSLRKPAQCFFHSISCHRIIGSSASYGEKEQIVSKDILKFNSVNLQTYSMIAFAPFYLVSLQN